MEQGIHSISFNPDLVSPIWLYLADILMMHQCKVLLTLIKLVSMIDFHACTDW